MKSELKHALTVKQSLLFTDLSVLGNSTEYFNKSLDINYQFKNFAYLDGDLLWNYDDDTDFNRSFLQRRSLGNAVASFIRNLSLTTSKLENTTHELLNRSAWETGDQGILAKEFSVYIEAYLKNMPFLFVFWNIEHLLFGRITQDLDTFFGRANSNLAIQKVMTPAKKTYFGKEAASFEKISRSVLSDSRSESIFLRLPTEDIIIQIQALPKIHNLLRKHCELFGFTTTACHLNAPLTTKDLIDRLKNSISKGVAHFDMRKQQEKMDIEETKNILKSLSDYPETYRLVGLARDLMFWKNQRLDVLFKSDLAIRPLFDKIGQVLNIPYSEIVFLTYEELSSSLLSKRLQVGSGEISRRQAAYYYLLSSGETTVSSDRPTSIDIYNDAGSINQSVNEVTELHGTPAYKGKAKGPVRLVLSMKDIALVKEGDILVTQMTRPEMMIGLEKAAAFVTDQGGALCHAAITSRELKKPCIVGTEIATKKLKDDQLVEVDADIGVIYITPLV